MSERKPEGKVSPVYAFARWLYGHIVRHFYRVSYEGLENVPRGGGYILCSNHRHLLDPVFIAYPIREQLFYMAKQELFRFRPFGAFLRGMGAFPVNRGTVDLAAVEKATAILEDGNILSIFPEGTRSRDGRPLPFKAGVAFLAAKMHLDVLPVSISCKGKVHWFSRITVRFGQRIPYAELGFSEPAERAEIREGARLLREKVTDMTDLYPESWKKE